MIRILSVFFCVALAAGFFGAFLRFMFMEAEIGDYSASLVVSQTMETKRPVELSAAGGVVPHHLLAKEIIEDFFKNLSAKAQPKTIVILSPDHFDASVVAGSEFFIGLGPGGENFGGLPIDKKLLEESRRRNIAVPGESFMALEHGITALIPFVENYFPNAEVLPLLAPVGLKKEKAEELVKILNEPDFRDSIIVASVDFSHYLSESVASFHDVKSISVLLDFRRGEFQKIEVDCWQCLYAVRMLAESRGRTKPEIIAHKNSVDFWKGEAPEETTSYFSVIFKKPAGAEELPTKEFLNARTVFFLGDIMLGRHVESLTKQHGFSYPFEKIKPFLFGADVIFGNLEGPITKKPGGFPAESLRFNFSPLAAESLVFGGITLVSLANNHALDMGHPGLAETREILKKFGVDFVGDSLKCGKEFLFEKDNLIFLAFNKTYPGICSEKEIIESVKTLREAKADSFLVVNFHWGEEYQSKSSNEQQKLARQVIDAGADAVFGHHPHVVQEIEIYPVRSGVSNGVNRQKPIFYSLGNFVFDQYFSQETQKGLAVGAEIYQNRAVFRLFPIKIQLSQPVLMGKGEREAFLKELAAKSAPELREKIISGIIEIDF